jgi:hypothetical protein
VRARLQHQHFRLQGQGVLVRLQGRVGVVALLLVKGRLPLDGHLLGLLAPPEHALLACLAPVGQRREHHGRARVARQLPLVLVGQRPPQLRRVDLAEADPVGAAGRGVAQLAPVAAARAQRHAGPQQAQQLRRRLGARLGRRRRRVERRPAALGLDLLVGAEAEERDAAGRRHVQQPAPHLALQHAAGVLVVQVRQRGVARLRRRLGQPRQHGGGGAARALHAVVPRDVVEDELSRHGALRVRGAGVRGTGVELRPGERLGGRSWLLGKELEEAAE